MTFNRRERYTREAIHDKLGGGSKQAYLPNKDGLVLCACLRTNTNPGAPDVILPGDGPEIQRSSELLCEQKSAIPVFIKRGVNDWEYVGNYVVDRWSESPAEIAEHARRAGRNDVTRVIYMRSAQNS
jgi:hypothetical protein